jgi:hypothetical protein
LSSYGATFGEELTTISTRWSTMPAITIADLFETFVESGFSRGLDGHESLWNLAHIWHCTSDLANIWTSRTKFHITTNRKTPRVCPNLLPGRVVSEWRRFQLHSWVCTMYSCSSGIIKTSYWNRNFDSCHQLSFCVGNNRVL